MRVWHDGQAQDGQDGQARARRDVPGRRGPSCRCSRRHLTPIIVRAHGSRKPAAPAPLLRWPPSRSSRRSVPRGSSAHRHRPLTRAPHHSRPDRHVRPRRGPGRRDRPAARPPWPRPADAGHRAERRRGHVCAGRRRLARRPRRAGIDGRRGAGRDRRRVLGGSDHPGARVRRPRRRRRGHRGKRHVQGIDPVVGDRRRGPCRWRHGCQIAGLAQHGRDRSRCRSDRGPRGRGLGWGSRDRCWRLVRLERVDGLERRILTDRRIVVRDVRHRRDAGGRIDPADRGQQLAAGRDRTGVRAARPPRRQPHPIVRTVMDSPRVRSTPRGRRSLRVPDVGSPSNSPGRVVATPPNVRATWTVQTAPATRSRRPRRTSPASHNPTRTATASTAGSGPIALGERRASEAPRGGRGQDGRHDDDDEHDRREAIDDRSPDRVADDVAHRADESPSGARRRRARRAGRPAHRPARRATQATTIAPTASAAPRPRPGRRAAPRRPTARSARDTPP